MDQLIELIKSSSSAFHCVKYCKEKLDESGFECLDLNETWFPALGKSYYTSPFPSVLIAFTVGENYSYNGNIRLALAHTDQPAIKIKPCAAMETGGYLKLNTERYGGLIHHTWLDRPLSIAGKVILRSSDIFAPKVELFDAKEGVVTIPSLAIHLNKEVNKGEELNPQLHLLPIASLSKQHTSKGDFFLNYLSHKMQINAADILDYDLFLYNPEEPLCMGFHKELFSAPRIDNLASVSALIEGITVEPRGEGLNVIALFDNEEIGSKSKQGADSNLLSFVLEKIYDTKGYSRAKYIEIIGSSFMLSVDGAHAMHPNYKEKHDPTNPVCLGDGIVIKSSASQRYVSDSEATGIIMQLCEAYQIPFQKQVNRSDMPGGQTLGPITSAYLPMKGVDIGIPMLAMHSARELAACSDYIALKNLVKAFFVS